MVGSPRSGYRYLGGPLWVDIVAFEKVGLVALERAARLARDKEGVAITDEIADMGLASARFVQSIETIFAHPAAVVATVHVKAHPVTDALKRGKEIELLTVTEVNRDDLPRRLFRQLTGVAAHDDLA